MRVEFEKILEIINLTKNISIKYRVVDNDNDIWRWNNWLTNPTGKYLDFGQEPISYSEINLIEIDPLEDKYIGKLVPNKLIDHTKEIKNILNTLKIEFEINETIISINMEL